MTIAYYCNTHGGHVDKTPCECAWRVDGMERDHRSIRDLFAQKAALEAANAAKDKRIGELEAALNVDERWHQRNKILMADAKGAAHEWSTTCRFNGCTLYPALEAGCAP